MMHIKLMYETKNLVVKEEQNVTHAYIMFFLLSEIHTQINVLTRPGIGQDGQ